MPATNWSHENVALILIDYQEEMFGRVRSETPANEIELNFVMLIRAAKAFGVPVILSTVGVASGANGPTRRSIQAELPGVKAIDRSSMNAWLDKPFQAAVKATGRKNLIFCALWTEICLAFPVIDAQHDGFETMFVVDAVGGTSQLEHRTDIERMIAAGAVPNTAFALLAELFVDWASPLAGKARELLAWYMPELEKIRGKRA
jgi:nicotinamidase-related amidase